MQMRCLVVRKRFCVCIDMRGDNLENEVGRVRVF